MTTPLESFRNPTPEDLSISPLLATGAPSAYGQTDVEGNVAYFNNVDSGVIKVEQGLVLPFGNQNVAGNPTIATDGAFHILAGVAATTISQMPSDVNGRLLVPIPGSYLYDVCIRIVVTGPSANWIVQIGVDINGTVLNPSTYAWPASLLTAEMNYTVNLVTFYPNDFVAAGNTSAIGFQVSVSGATTATVNFLDGQLNYIGTFPGETKVHPSSFVRGVDTPLWTPE